VRTSGKDDAAEYIENEVLAKGRWPMDLVDIADEAGWSRQHIANTLDDYFTFVESGNGNDKEDVERTRVPMPPDDVSGERVYIEIPNDVDEESYIRGYFAGWLDGRERNAI
jgi:hypothetical protein